MKNYVTTLGIALTLALPHAALAQGVTPPPMPTNIEVDPPNEVLLVGHGVGTQNYECQPVSSLGRVDWMSFTPQDTLVGDRDEQLTTHFSSPSPFEPGIVRVTWQDSRDTSIVWGQAIASLGRQFRQGRRDSLARDRRRKHWSPGRTNGRRSSGNTRA